MTETQKLPKVPEKALEALKAGITKVLETKDWAGFITAIKQIHDYSFNNRLLIMMEQWKRQYPNTQFVAGRTKWKDKFNRTVKQEEVCKPIWILAPVMIDKRDENGNVILKPDGKPVQVPIRFRGVRVYDQHQTEGDPIPEIDAGNILTQVNEGGSIELLNALVNVGSQRNIDVKLNIPIEELGHAWGCCYFRNEGRASEIKIRAELTLPTQISVLAHELGHALLHNRDEYQEHDSTSIKELEAESVAFLVCSHYGIDLGTRSFEYIVHHNVGTDDVVADLLRSGERIIRAYEQITTTVEMLMKLEQRVQKRELVAA